MKELQKLIFSFGYALRGIGYAIKKERNFRIHLTALAVVVVFNCMAELSLLHWCVEILCCALVLSLELMNTALEAACDKISQKQHPLIGHAKDAAAGGVLVSAIGSALIAFLIFFGDQAYRRRTVEFLQGRGWAKWVLVFGAVLAILFIFLPSYLQKQKKQ